MTREQKIIDIQSKIISLIAFYDSIIRQMDEIFIPTIISKKELKTTKRLETILSGLAGKEDIITVTSAKVLFDFRMPIDNSYYAFGVSVTDKDYIIGRLNMDEQVVLKSWAERRGEIVVRRDKLHNSIEHIEEYYDVTIKLRELRKIEENIPQEYEKLI